MIDDGLFCPSCLIPVSIETALTNSTVSWPTEKWVYFRCECCGNYAHLEVENDYEANMGSVKIGHVESIAPDFICHSRILSPDLYVEIRRELMIVEYTSRKYIFPAHDSITQATIQLVEKLFPAADKEDVLLLLTNECGGNLPLVDEGSPLIEHIRLAAIKVSNGDKTKLCEAIEQAKNDWRDLLVWADQIN